MNKKRNVKVLLLLIMDVPNVDRILLQRKQFSQEDNLSYLKVNIIVVER